MKFAVVVRGGDGAQTTNMLKNLGKTRVMNMFSNKHTTCSVTSTMPVTAEYAAAANSDNGALPIER